MKLKEKSNKKKTWVNPSEPTESMRTWDWDNPIERKVKKIIKANLQPAKFWDMKLKKGLKILKPAWSNLQNMWHGSWDEIAP